MKRVYKIPITQSFQTEMDPFMLERMSQGPEVVDGPTDAKEQGDVIDDETELAAPIKDKWEDLSEKKIAK
jgi:hypothetical protein